MGRRALTATVTLEADGSNFGDVLELAEPIIKRIIKTFRPSLSGTVLDADDLQQELEIHVWKIYPKFDPQRSKLSTYLNESLRNRACELIRYETAQKRGGESEVESLDSYIDKDEEGNTILDYTEDESVSLEANASCRDIIKVREEVLNSFDPIHAKAIRMIMVGKRQTDIAKTLGLSQSMVSQAYMRFRRIMARRLEAMGYVGVHHRMRKHATSN